jgi:hypothetical protein
MKKFTLPNRHLMCLTLALFVMSESVAARPPEGNSRFHKSLFRKPITGTLTIAASANPICAGTSVTFTATIVSGGASPSYQWHKNGANVGANSATYSCDFHRKT